MMICREDAAFSRDLKRLAKKWRTLPEDIEVAKQVISPLYTAKESVETIQFRQNFFDGKTATILSSASNYEVIKMRLDCASPGAQNKVRLIFVFVVTAKTITLLELFSKNDKAREDKERISGFISELPPNS